jgi:hypothetical protein
MKPADTLARLPQAPGICSRCRAPLLDSRSAAVELIAGRHRLVCRDLSQCRERRKERTATR